MLKIHTLPETGGDTVSELLHYDMRLSEATLKAYMRLP